MYRIRHSLLCSAPESGQGQVGGSDAVSCLADATNARKHFCNFLEYPCEHTSDRGDSLGNKESPTTAPASTSISTSAVWLLPPFSTALSRGCVVPCRSVLQPRSMQSESLRLSTRCLPYLVVARGQHHGPPLAYSGPVCSTRRQERHLARLFRPQCLDCVERASATSGSDPAGNCHQTWLQVHIKCIYTPSRRTVRSSAGHSQSTHCYPYSFRSLVL